MVQKLDEAHYSDDILLQDMNFFILLQDAILNNEITIKLKAQVEMHHFHFKVNCC